MTEPLIQEQQFFDQAVERLKNTRRTFTSREALQEAIVAHYDLHLQYDERFVKAQPGKGVSGKHIDPHFRLRDHTLANLRLFNDLMEGEWDGYDLNGRLAALDEEEGGHHVFYPHDPRLTQNRQGRWMPREETNISLPPEQKSALDALLSALMQAWQDDGSQPWTTQQIITALKQAGWSGADLPNALPIIRAWLLETEDILRVGQDFWLPADQLPALVQRTRLQVSPIKPIWPEETQVSGEQSAPEKARSSTNSAGLAPQSADPVIIGGEVESLNANWTTTLRTINTLAGFLTIPAGARSVYPAVSPGEQAQHIALRAMWHADGEQFWLWFDRQQHRLYGPDLLRKFEWDTSPGDILRILWAQDIITVHLAGHNDQVQQEERRHIDPETLKGLRRGLGESYRRSIQEILTMTPGGLTRQEIVQALSQRQQHEVHHGTVLALLYKGGFIQRDRRWFAARDSAAARRALNTALMETLLPPRETTDVSPLSTHEYIRLHAQAIQERLEEISRLL